jgi:hypothetical protein
MPAGWISFRGRVRDIQVPGESLFLDCQDYVMEIWNIVGECGMVNPDTYEQGRESMMACYGQDYGGQQEDADEYEDEEKRTKRQICVKFVRKNSSTILIARWAAFNYGHFASFISRPGTGKNGGMVCMYKKPLDDGFF